MDEQTFSLEAQIAELEEIVDKLIEEKEDLEVFTMDQSSVIAMIHKENVMLSRELVISQGSVHNLQAKIKYLEEEVDFYEGECIEYDGELEDLKGQIDNLEDTVDLLELDNLSAEERVEFLEESLKISGSQSLIFYDAYLAMYEMEIESSSSYMASLQAGRISEESKGSPKELLDMYDSLIYRFKAKRTDSVNNIGKLIRSAEETHDVLMARQAQLEKVLSDKDFAASLMAGLSLLSGNAE